MITAHKLRRKIGLLSAQKDLQKIKRSSFVNETFAGDFNYSIGEEPIIRKFGKYLPIEKNWSFSVFQPCIRVIDFYKEIRKSFSDDHLMVFEMCDIGGIHISADSDGRAIIKDSIGSAVRFLTEDLKIKQNRIYASFFSGNSLEALSGNRHAKKRFFDSDRRTCEELMHLGFSEDHLIPDNTRRTFVLNNFPFEFYAGYRSELFVADGHGKKIEVGTFEFLNYKTDLDAEGKLIDVEPMAGFFGGCAIGLERILMIVNNYSSIIQCDHILPLYKSVLGFSKNKNEKAARIICEIIRFLWSAAGDGYDYSADRYYKRKKIVKKIVHQLFREADFLKIDLEKKLSLFFEINAGLVGWKSDFGGNRILKRLEKMIIEIEKNEKIYLGD